MGLNFTYYPNTKTVINALRITEKKNDFIVTIYYRDNQKLVKQDVMKKFQIKDVDNIMRDHHDHEAIFHKKDKPFEFHAHLKVKKKYLFDFLKTLGLENLHINRFKKEIKDQKFKDGSIMEIEALKIMKDHKEHSYLILNNLASQEEIDNIFKVRGNWKEFEYGDDPYLDLFFIDHRFFTINFFYIHNNIIKNVFDNNLKERGIINLYKIFKNPSLLEKIKINNYILLFPLTNQQLSTTKIFKDTKNLTKYIRKIIKDNQNNWKKGIVKITQTEETDQMVRKKKTDSQDKWLLRDMQNFYDGQVLLYQGKEFVLTMHYIFTPEGNKGFLHNQIKITTADIKYNQKDFSNPKMHFFNNYLNIDVKDFLGRKYNSFIKQAKEEIKIEGKCYPENKYCFMIFRVQIYLDKDYKLHIWSIDNQLDYFNDKKIFLDILDGISYHILDKIFPPVNKVKKYKNFLLL